jgi:hypothetical protein
MMRSLFTGLAAVCVLAGLAGCGAPEVEAPADVGVCWHMVSTKDKKVHFYKLAVKVPNLERCAGSLEAMRMRFLGLGGSNTEVDGAYQGQFLFIDQRGVFTSTTINGTPYLALVPTGDGRLAMPGAVQQ